MDKPALSWTLTEHRGDGFGSLSFEQLETFRAIVRAGAFSRAADLLFLTQPAISQRIKHLEQALGVHLFHRDGNRRDLRLTAAGRDVLVFADEVITRLERLRLDIKDENGLEQWGTIVIACTFTPARFALPDLLTTFYERYPYARVNVIQTTVAKINGIIRSGKAELGVVMGTYVNEGFRFVPIFHDRLVLIASPDYPASLDSELKTDGLQRCPFILTDLNSELRQTSERWAASLHLGLDVVVEVGSVDVLKEMVMRGIGLSLAPAIAVANEVREGRLRILAAPGLPKEWYFYLISDAEHTLSPAAQCLVHIAREKSLDAACS